MLGNVKSLFKVYRQVAYVLNKEQKKKSIWVFFTMLICSCLELLGVSIMAPFLESVVNSDELSSKWYMSWFYNIYPDISSTDIMLILCVCFMFIYIIKNLFMIYSAKVQSTFAASFQRENFVRMLTSYLSRPYEFFLNNNSGLLARYVENDVHAVYQILIAGFVMLAESLTIVMIGIFLIVTDWIIAIASLMLAVVCFLVIIICFKGKIKAAGRENRDASAEQHKHSLQAINGIKEITVLDRKEVFLDEYERVSIRFEKSNRTYEFLNACPDRILEGICISGFMGIACIRIIMGGNINTFIPVLGTFAMGAFKILPSISKISSRINTIIYYMPGLNNCYENFKEVENYNQNETSKAISSEGNDNLGNIKFTDKLTLTDLVWKYDRAKAPVINGLELNINKGESVAFIGPSGAGKTTLADIVLGLLPVQSGAVLMDGVDIKTIPRSWAHIIGYVPQSVFLIDDTIKRNIAFGLPEDKIDEDKVWKALEQAQLRGYIESLPDKLETEVGERGIKLSGGQRQRIAIARALYEDPDILVLDEATSALDTETETAVMESIDALQGTKTLIIVAHRLSTIRNCDKIYEINGGVATLQDKEKILANV